MLPELKFLPVNWIDGMKINEGHFQSLEMSIGDQVRDAIGIALSNTQFGLISPAAENDRSLDIDIRIDPTKLVSINLLKCRAVMRSGARVEIVSSLAKRFNFTFPDLRTEYDVADHKARIFYVVITADPTKRISVGQVDREESPPRFPFTVPAYSLAVLPADQLSRENMPDYLIPIGKIIATGTRFTVDNTYIPPCTAVRNHSVLYDHYFDLGNKLGEISRHLITIIHKIKTKSQSSTLTQNFNFMAEKVVFFTANEMSRYRWAIAEQPPVFMMEYFIRLAYVMKTSIDCMVGRDKEELIAYLSEWSDQNTGQFESLFTDVIRSEYDHLDMAQTLAPAIVMINSVHALFGKLSQLDFIGKRKGEGSFVRERIVDAEEPKKETEKPKQKGWSFLAD